MEAGGFVWQTGRLYTTLKRARIKCGVLTPAPDPFYSTYTTSLKAHHKKSNWTETPALMYCRLKVEVEGRDVCPKLRTMCSYLWFQLTATSLYRGSCETQTYSINMTCGTHADMLSVSAQTSWRENDHTSSQSKGIRYYQPYLYYSSMFDSFR
jgi:hypothetical protein